MNPHAASDDDWMSDAACRAYDSAIFFPTDRRGWNIPDYIDPTAARLCAGCPVADTCLDYALAHHLEGTWGGTTTEGRNRLRRNHTRARQRAARNDLTGDQP